LVNAFSQDLKRLITIYAGILGMAIMALCSFSKNLRLHL
jgi:hypothetical protein